jgi:hypothetical protein
MAGALVLSGTAKRFGTYLAVGDWIWLCRRVPSSLGRRAAARPPACGWSWGWRSRTRGTVGLGDQDITGLAPDQHDRYGGVPARPAPRARWRAQPPSAHPWEYECSLTILWPMRGGRWPSGSTTNQSTNPNCRCPDLAVIGGAWVCGPRLERCRLDVVVLDASTCGSGGQLGETMASAMPA